MSSGFESSTRQCGCLQTTAISTTHWQGLTTGSQHRGPERCLGCELVPQGFTSCATGTLSLPRRPHGGEIPPVDFVAPCFRPPFGEGSNRTVEDLTRPARILDFVLRKTLLPRTGYRDGFTQIQQWLVAHLISQIPFDLWDLIVSEIEDTISESFRGRRQLPLRMKTERKYFVPTAFIFYIMISFSIL